MGNTLRALYFFFFIFAGYGQMLIGYASPLYHFSLTVILLIDVFVFGKNVKKINLIPLLMIILFLAYYLHPSNTIDKLTFEYLLKAVLYMVWFFVIQFLNISLKTLNSFFKITITFTLLGIFLQLNGFIDHDKTSSNYLTVGLLIGFSLIISIYSDIFDKKKKLFLIFLLVFSSLSIASRGSIIFSFFVILLYSLRSRKNVFLFIISLVSIYFSVNIFIRYFNINSWLYFKMTRLLVGDFDEEPRAEIYPQVFEYLLENLPFFGSGFSSSYLFSTSWDSKLPFIESFPLELILNFGIFGLLILIYIYRSYIKLYKFSAVLFMLNLYLFLNYSKSWSVYSGFVLIVFLAFSLQFQKKINV